MIKQKITLEFTSKHQIEKKLLILLFKEYDFCSTLGAKCEIVVLLCLRFITVIWIILEFYERP